MKGIKYILIAVLSLQLTACNFLETEPYDYLEQDDIYRTESSCMAGLAGVYDALGSLVKTYGPTLMAVQTSWFTTAATAKIISR